jgi:hypothetical protein
MKVSKLTENIKSLYIQKNNEKEEMLQKAIAHTQSVQGVLSIREFIDKTGFKLDEIMSLDIMWNTFQKNIPIYITDDLIKMFGYKGPLIDQKKNLLKLVKKYNIPIVQLTNDEYKEFTQGPETLRNIDNPAEETKQDFNISDLYPEITKAQLKSRPLHTLIMPRDLKKLWLVVNTSNGNSIREYVITLEELFNLYLEYQSIYKSHSIEIKDKKIDELIEELKGNTKLLKDMREEQEVQTDSLNEVVEKLDKATYERAPKTKSLAKQGRFIIAEIKSPESSWTHYVIRAQQTTAVKAFDKINNDCKDSKKISDRVRYATLLVFGTPDNNPYYDPIEGLSLFEDIATVDPVGYFHLFIIQLCKKNYIRAFEAFKQFYDKLILIDDNGFVYPNLAKTYYDKCRRNVKFYTREIDYFDKVLSYSKYVCQTCHFKKYPHTCTHAELNYIDLKIISNMRNLDTKFECIICCEDNFIFSDRFRYNDMECGYIPYRTDALNINICEVCKNIWCRRCDEYFNRCPFCRSLVKYI